MKDETSRIWSLLDVRIDWVDSMQAAAETNTAVDVAVLLEETAEPDPGWLTQHGVLLALIHEPDLAFEAHAQGADLILAGHTHGGQVKLPLIGAPYTHRVDPRITIAAGFQRIGAGLLHITSGLGHTIPLRFRCPPEVAWLEVSGRLSRQPG